MPTNTPTKGCRFQHRHWLDVSHWPQHVPISCVVTRVAQGVVYYRPDYGTHDDGTPWLGSPSYIAIDKFETIAKAQQS